MLSLRRIALERIASAIVRDNLDASGYHFSEPDSNLFFDLIRRETELTTDIVTRLPSLRLTCVNLKQMRMTWEDIHVIRNQPLVSFDMGIMEESVKEMYAQVSDSPHLRDFLEDLFGDDDTARRRLKHLSIVDEDRDSEWRAATNWSRELSGMFPSLESLDVGRLYLPDGFAPVPPDHFFDAFRNLTALDISTTGIGSIRGIEQLQRLETLVMTFTWTFLSLDDFRPLFELRNLRRLDLSESGAGYLDDAHREEFSGIRLFVECALEHGCRLPSLETFDMSKSFVEDADIQVVIDTHQHLKTLKIVHHFLETPLMNVPPTMRVLQSESFEQSVESFEELCRTSNSRRFRTWSSRQEPLGWAVTELLIGDLSDEAIRSAFRLFDLHLDELKRCNGRDALVLDLIQEISTLISIECFQTLDHNRQDRLIKLSVLAMRRSSDNRRLKKAIFKLWKKAAFPVRNRQYAREMCDKAYEIIRLNDFDCMEFAVQLLHSRGDRNCVELLNQPEDLVIIRRNLMHYVDLSGSHTLGLGLLKVINSCETAPPMDALIQRLFGYWAIQHDDPASVLFYIAKLLEGDEYLDQLDGAGFETILRDLKRIGYKPDEHEDATSNRNIYAFAFTMTVAIMASRTPALLFNLIEEMESMECGRDDLMWRMTRQFQQQYLALNGPLVQLLAIVEKMVEFVYCSIHHYGNQMSDGVKREMLYTLYTVRTVTTANQNNKMCWIGFWFFTSFPTTPPCVELRNWALELLVRRVSDVTDALGLLDDAERVSEIRANLMGHVERNNWYSQGFHVLKYVNNRPVAMRTPGILRRVFGWVSRYDRCELILQHLFEQFQGPPDVDEFQALDFSAAANHILQLPLTPDPRACQLPDAIFALTGIICKLMLWSSTLPSLKYYNNTVVRLMMSHLRADRPFILPTVGEPIGAHVLLFTKQLLRGAKTPAMVLWSLWSIKCWMAGRPSEEAMEDYRTELQPFVDEILSTRKLGDVELNESIVRVADGIREVATDYYATIAVTRFLFIPHFRVTQRAPTDQ